MTCQWVLLPPVPPCQLLPPAGIRIGGPGGGGRALKIAQERRFQNYRDDVTLDVRQIKVSLKGLRQLTRTGPEEKRTVVLGIDKLFPREMTRELLHIKGHLDTMLSLMGEGVVEIDQDHRILYANPAACRLLGSDDHRLFGKSLPGCFKESERIEPYLASVPCGTSASPPPLQFEHGPRTLRISFSTLVEASNYCGSIVILEDVTAQVRRERSLLDLMEATCTAHCDAA
jgi:PAS domain-containing protein